MRRRLSALLTEGGRHAPAANRIVKLIIENARSNRIEISFLNLFLNSRGRHLPVIQWLPANFSAT